MMNKHIFYYLMVGSMALLLGACNDSMNDLLEPKVYFESKEYNFSVEDEMDVMTFDLEDLCGRNKTRGQERT